MSNVETLWRPIVSLSTQDEIDVELKLPGGPAVGHWCPRRQCWVKLAGDEHAPIGEGIYPSQWRPLLAIPSDRSTDAT